MDTKLPYDDEKIQEHVDMTKRSIVNNLSSFVRKHFMVDEKLEIKK